jgi:hypothetical protein
MHVHIISLKRECSDASFRISGVVIAYAFIGYDSLFFLFSLFYIIKSMVVQNVQNVHCFYIFESLIVQNVHCLCL